jgi:hypothetical protein
MQDVQAGHRVNSAIKVAAYEEGVGKHSFVVDRKLLDWSPIRPEQS